MMHVLVLTTNNEYIPDIKLGIIIINVRDIPKVIV